MAQRCDLCQKGPASGNNRSHSMRATRRRFMPNIQRIRFLDRGSSVSVKACTRCIRTLAKNPRERKQKAATVATA